MDQYGRLIARCATDEVRDIGAELVAAGMAWAFIKYSTDYVGLEKAPRAKKIGIWAIKDTAALGISRAALGDRGQAVFQ